jgi:hypothetical protein
MLSALTGNPMNFSAFPENVSEVSVVKKRKVPFRVILSSISGCRMR